ncbi:MAG: alanine racemase [Acetobacter sp.]|nr:alanine racemase [Acetobacter sp.]MBR2125013.1 alanine racemase [Acetobacter sp.]
MSCSVPQASTVLSIDLAALVRNYAFLARQVPKALCAAVVKADAYGLGVAHIAPALEGAGVREFFVAHVDEGLFLRPLLSQQSHITVLHACSPEVIDICFAHNLRPVLNSLDHISWVRSMAHLRGQKINVALQIDTGMSRLGLPPTEIESLIENPTALDGLSLSLIMSHLACADTPHHPANAQQRARFCHYTTLLPQAPLSLAASSGIFLGENYHFNLVRPGAALYGINPLFEQPNPLEAVVQLQAPILQIRTLNKGDCVGYGLTWQADKRHRVATIGIGYAHGFARRGAAQGCAWFKGYRLPILGRISMDSMAVDISNVPESQFQGERKVDLLNKTYGVDDLAKAQGTIGYEILTSFGQCSHRFYTNDSYSAKKEIGCLQHAS